MKYSSLLTILAFLVVSAGSAFGQDADVKASANVIAELELNNVSDLFFGDIVAGTENVEVGSDGVNNNASSNATRGELSLTSGAGDSEVTFSKTSTTTLSGNTLTLDGAESADELTVELEYATSVDEGSNVTAYIFGDPVSLQDGDITLLIGGEITSTTNVTSEVYSATLTYTAELDI